MTRLTHVLILVPLLAQAQMFKCMRDGEPTYQDTPCDKGATQVKSEVVSDTFSGCYEAKVPYTAPGGGPTTKFQIRLLHGSYSFMTFAANPMPSSISSRSYSYSAGRYSANFQQQQTVFSQGGTLLRFAPKDELAIQSKNLGFNLDKGISTGIPWNATEQSRRPVGLYTGTNRQGEPILVASLHNGSGVTERILCPKS